MQGGLTKRMDENITWGLGGCNMARVSNRRAKQLAESRKTRCARVFRDAARLCILLDNSGWRQQQLRLQPTCRRATIELWSRHFGVIYFTVSLVMGVRCY